MSEQACEGLLHMFYIMLRHTRTKTDDSLDELETSRDLGLENAIRVVSLRNSFECGEIVGAIALQDLLSRIGIVKEDVRIVKAPLFRQLLDEVDGLLN